MLNLIENNRNTFSIIIFFFLNILLFTNHLFIHMDVFSLSFVHYSIIIALITMLFLLKYHIFGVLYIIIISVFFFLGYTEYIKIISIPYLLFLSYIISLRNMDKIKKFFVFIVILNFFVIIMEMNFPIKELLEFKTYHLDIYHPDFKPQYNWPIWVEDYEVPLYQIRPSGIFNSTINFSFEMIFILAILLFSDMKNNISMFFLLVVSVFSGSDALLIASIILPILTFGINEKKRIFFILTMLFLTFVLYTYLYPYFSAYNYNLKSTFTSILSRLDFDSVNSTFTSYGVVSVILLFIISLYAFVKSVSNNTLKYLYVIFTVVSVLLLHNLILSIKFYIYLGILLGIMKAYYDKKVYTENGI